MDPTYGTSGPTPWYREPARRPQPGPAIIVPLDGSARAEVALPVARALAEIRGGTLHLVHVAREPRPFRRLVRELRLTRHDLTGSVVDPRVGEPAEQILEIAHGAPGATVVLCARAGAQGELGPVAREVLCRAQCPIVVVRPERGLQPWSLQRLLLAHDGSPASASAFPPAVRLAEQSAAHLFVLHVAQLVGASEEGTLPLPTYVDQPHHEWPGWAREFLERLDVYCALPVEVQPRVFLARGEPGPEIVRFAQDRDVDLIALAWRGGLGPERARTVKRVLAQAHCPVLFQRIAPDAPVLPFEPDEVPQVH